MRETQIAKFLNEGADTIPELVRRMYTFAGENAWLRRHALGTSAYGTYGWNQPRYLRRAGYSQFRLCAGTGINEELCIGDVLPVTAFPKVSRMMGTARPSTRWRSTVVALAVAKVCGINAK